ncbi:hypothetical protein SDC9_153856 [bioreactor metagenome]|uniref:Uncharacterized protein n=2 Tax=root TaxID=1 RepID=A0A645EYP7_9ZZZZ
MKGNYILGLESTSSRMFNNGKSTLFLNKINKPEDIIKKIDSIDMEKIQRVMEYTFKNGILNSAYVGDKLDLDGIKSLLEGDITLFKSDNNDIIV